MMAAVSGSDTVERRGFRSPRAGGLTIVKVTCIHAIFWWVLCQRKRKTAHAWCAGCV